MADNKTSLFEVAARAFERPLAPTEQTLLILSAAQLSFEDGSSHIRAIREMLDAGAYESAALRLIPSGSALLFKVLTGNQRWPIVEWEHNSRTGYSSGADLALALGQAAMRIRDALGQQPACEPSRFA